MSSSDNTTIGDEPTPAPAPARPSVPTFPYSYPPASTGYDTPGFHLTLAEQAELDTFRRLEPEVQRRFVGLQLCLLVEEGVGLGIGTGWRVQPPAGTEHHSDPGNSYHEGMPVESVARALAIDTVGLPSHEAAWTAMERRLAEFGFVSFTKPAIAANSSGVLYNGDWDRPHIQPFEVPYSRHNRTEPFELPAWTIPPQYDLHLIDINDPLRGHQQQEEDDVKFVVQHPVTNQYYVTDLASFATPVTPSIAAAGRDEHGWQVADNKGPIPLDQEWGDFVAGLAGLAA